MVAAVGRHILTIRPPGAGKTMLATRLPTVLPPLSLQKALETTRIYSASGKLAGNTSLMATRPLRQPHHSISSAALIGGGTIPQAGEVSLARANSPQSSRTSRGPRMMRTPRTSVGVPGGARQ